MNYNVLRYFSVLAQTEHYTIAAARLGISQPSLSNAIQNLEADLGGIKLFEKTGRNIRLTNEGKFYQEKVDAALNELHTASLMLRESKLTAPIVIHMGFISGTLDGIVAKKIVEYNAANNRIRFHLTESSSDNLLDMIRQEKLDMAIVDCTDRDQNLHFRKLLQRDFYVALPETHPLANQELIDPREIIHEPQVLFNYNATQSFKDWSSDTPSTENIVCTVNTVQSALDLIAAGIGIAFIPDKCAQPHSGVRFVPLKNWHQPLYMCILYNKWLEPPVWDFLETIVKAIRKSSPKE